MSQLGCQTQSESAFDFSFFFFTVPGKVFPVTSLLVVSSCIESSARILMGFKG